MNFQSTALRISTLMLLLLLVLFAVTVVAITSTSSYHPEITIFSSKSKPFLQQTKERRNQKQLHHNAINDTSVTSRSIRPVHDIIGYESHVRKTYKHHDGYIRIGRRNLAQREVAVSIRSLSSDGSGSVVAEETQTTLQDDLLQDKSNQQEYVDEPSNSSISSSSSSTNTTDITVDNTTTTTTTANKDKESNGHSLLSSGNTAHIATLSALGFIGTVAVLAGLVFGICFVWSNYHKARNHNTSTIIITNEENDGHDNRKCCCFCFWHYHHRRRRNHDDDHPRKQQQKKQQDKQQQQQQQQQKDSHYDDDHRIITIAPAANCTTPTSHHHHPQHKQEHKSKHKTIQQHRFFTGINIANNRTSENKYNSSRRTSDHDNHRQQHMYLSPAGTTGTTTATTPCSPTSNDDDDAHGRSPPEPPLKFRLIGVVGNGDNDNDDKSNDLNCYRRNEIGTKIANDNNSDNNISCSSQSIMSFLESAGRAYNVLNNGGDDGSCEDTSITNQSGIVLGNETIGKTTATAATATAADVENNKLGGGNVTSVQHRSSSGSRRYQTSTKKPPSSNNKKRIRIGVDIAGMSIDSSNMPSSSTSSPVDVQTIRLGGGQYSRNNN